MWLQSPGLFLLLLGGLPTGSPGAEVQEVHALVGSVAELGCVSPRRASFDLQDLFVYWQVRVAGKLLSVAFYLGHNSSEDPDPQFLGRAHLSPEAMRRGDFSLRLSHVGPRDRLTFRCLVLRKSLSMAAELDISVRLSVAANYSTPVVTVTSESTAQGGGLTFTCVSTDGFPEPRLHWLNRSDGSPLPGALTNCSLNPRGLFDVVSVLRLPPSPAASVACCVENVLLQQNLSSPPEPSPSPSPSSSEADPLHGGNSGTTLSVLGGLVVLVAVVAGWACRSQCPPRGRYAGVQEAKPEQELVDHA